MMHWYVLCVTPGMEPRIANILRSIGIEVFCPTSNEVGNWSKRKKTASAPLFPSYIFVKISKRNRVTVFNVPGTIRYLFFEGRPVQVLDSEINTMKSWIEDDSVYEIIISKYSATKNTIAIRNNLVNERQSAINETVKDDLSLVLKSLDIVLYAKVKNVVKERKLNTHFYAD